MGTTTVCPDNCRCRRNARGDAVSAVSAVLCSGDCGKREAAEPGRLPPQGVSYHDLPLCRGCHVRRDKLPALKALVRTARQESRRRAAGGRR
jgi:hypothetical protein